MTEHNETTTENTFVGRECDSCGHEIEEPHTYAGGEGDKLAMIICKGCARGL